MRSVVTKVKDRTASKNCILFSFAFAPQSLLSYPCSAQMTKFDEGISICIERNNC